MFFATFSRKNAGARPLRPGWLPVCLFCNGKGWREKKNSCVAGAEAKKKIRGQKKVVKIEAKGEGKRKRKKEARALLFLLSFPSFSLLFCLFPSLLFVRSAVGNSNDRAWI